MLSLTTDVATHSPAAAPQTPRAQGRGHGLWCFYLLLFFALSGIGCLVWPPGGHGEKDRSNSGGAAGAGVYPGDKVHPAPKRPPAPEKRCVETIGWDASVPDASAQTDAGTGGDASVDALPRIVAVGDLHGTIDAAVLVHDVRRAADEALSAARRDLAARRIVCAGVIENFASPGSSSVSYRRAA